MGNLTRKKRKRDERSFVVSDSVIVGDISKVGYETALDSRQQEVGAMRPRTLSEDADFMKNGGFETPADNGTLTNFVEMGQARDKILSLKLDQVC